MKKRFLLTLGLFCSLHAISQQAPTPNPPADPTTSLPNTQKGAYAWYRGGNTPASNPAGTSNLFGTLWNSPIYTVTNGVNRMTLMGTNPPGSISGALGLGTILPQSYLHLSNFGTGAFTANGELFRTTGNESVTNNWRMYTGNKFGNTENSE